MQGYLCSSEQRIYGGSFDIHVGHVYERGPVYLTDLVMLFRCSEHAPKVYDLLRPDARIGVRRGFDEVISFPVCAADLVSGPRLRMIFQEPVRVVPGERISVLGYATALWEFYVTVSMRYTDAAPGAVRVAQPVSEPEPRKTALVDVPSAPWAPREAIPVGVQGDWIDDLEVF